MFQHQLAELVQEREGIQERLLFYGDVGTALKCSMSVKKSWLKNDQSVGKTTIFLMAQFGHGICKILSIQHGMWILSTVRWYRERFRTNPDFWNGDVRHAPRGWLNRALVFIVIRW